MADELADLVLPDSTPVRSLPDEEDAKPVARSRSPGAGLRNGFARFRLPRAGDFLIAACGIGLAALCAVFPWYIFFNQEQFGIRPLTFSGDRGDRGFSPDSRARLADRFAETPQLDFIPTGTVPEAPPFDIGDIPEQPFPGTALDFHLLHVANGRAMIEDQDGFWLVQRGSRLPDGSRVAQILQKEGIWVLVTSEDKEITLTR